VFIPVQVNGKVRGRIEVPRAASDAEIIAAALADASVKAHVDGKRDSPPGRGARTPRQFRSVICPRQMSTDTQHSALRTQHWCLFVTLLSVIGCGYHLAGERSGLPDDVRSLSVGTIQNRSRQHGLEKTLAFALEREIHERRPFSDGAGSGGWRRGGERHDPRREHRPVGFDSNDIAVQYEMALVVDLTLTRQRDGRVLWHVRAVAGER